LGIEPVGRNKPTSALRRGYRNRSFARRDPDKGNITLNPPTNNKTSFLIIFLLWAGSAAITYFLAALSINVSVIKAAIGLAFVCLVTAAFLASIEKSRLALFVAISPSPLLIAGAIFFGLFDYFLTPIFEAEPYATACRNTEETYFTSRIPTFHSIAYDWDGNYDPGANTYKIGLFGRLATTDTNERPRIDNDVMFTERRRGNNYGVPAKGLTKYVRRYTRTSPEVDIDALTADILVTYKISPENKSSKAPIGRESKTHEIIVTDRRNGQQIARLRYVVDQKNSRICGVFKNKVLSEDSFLLTALGLN